MALFVGDRIDPATQKRAEKPVLLDPADFTTHGVIVGMTGSGKTGLGMVLLEECLLAGVPVLVIDPKGDMGNLALTFPDLAPRDFEPYVLETDAKKAGRSVAEHAAEVAKTWTEGLASWGLDGSRVRALRDAAAVTIYTPGSSVGVPLNIVGNLSRPGDDVDGETLQDEIDSLVASLLNLVGIESDPLSGREHILLSNLVAHAWNNGQDLDLAALVGQVQQPPIRKLGVIELDTFFPEKDRIGLALRLNGLLASPAFAAWAQGVPLDIPSMLYTPDGRPRAAIVQLSHLSDEERQFVVTLVLSKLVTWMRQQSGTSDLRALVYMDEVFGFVPPSAAPPAKKPILTIFKQARAFGVGMVLATQNPVDVDYKALSNAGTWMIGRLQTERDKARLMEGLKDAAGATDLEMIDKTISGLGKRQFVLRTAKANEPTVFTSRWALSYLSGPLSRDQVAALTAEAPERSAAAAVTTAATGAGGGAGSGASAASSAALGDDESAVAPKVADGIPVRYLDPAAGWAREIGAVAGGTRLEPALVARVHLVFDDEKADLREQQEWEAVFFPVAGEFDATAAVHVDYDERDFRSDAPAGVRYVIGDADFSKAPWFNRARTDLQDHLYRSLTMEIFTNRSLKLFSRAGESRDDFEARCQAAADERTDAEADKVREQMATRIERVQDAIAKAEDKVREVSSDKQRRGAETVISVAGGLLGSLLGGKKNTKGILSTIGRGVSKGGMQRQSGQRLETAKNRLGEQQQELEELEAEVADKLEAIADAWDDKAADIEAVTVSLEKADVRVDEIAVVWVPTA
jgi:hypothetical protein